MAESITTTIKLSPNPNVASDAQHPKTVEEMKINNIVAVESTDNILIDSVGNFDAGVLDKIVSKYNQNKTAVSPSPPNDGYATAILKYQKMLKVRVPMENVLQKMKNDGIGQTIIDRFTKENTTVQTEPTNLTNKMNPTNLINKPTNQNIKPDNLQNKYMTELKEKIVSPNLKKQIPDNETVEQIYTKIYAAIDNFCNKSLINNKNVDSVQQSLASLNQFINTTIKTNYAEKLKKLGQDQFDVDSLRENYLTEYKKMTIEELIAELKSKKLSAKGGYKSNSVDGSRMSLVGKLRLMPMFASTRKRNIKSSSYKYNKSQNGQRKRSKLFGQSTVNRRNSHGKHIRFTRRH